MSSDTGNSSDFYENQILRLPNGQNRQNQSEECVFINSALKKQCVIISTKNISDFIG